MRKTFIIKCKVPVEFHVDAPTAEGAIDTIRSMFSDREETHLRESITKATKFVRQGAIVL